MTTETGMIDLFVIGGGIKGAGGAPDAAGAGPMPLLFDYDGAVPGDPENPVTYNWFTGNGMVHGVRIRYGKAEWYRNRFVRDDHVARSKGLPPLPGPGQAPGLPAHAPAALFLDHAMPVLP